MSNLTVTANIIGGATIQANVALGTPVTANVTTGGRGDIGPPGTTDHLALLNTGDNTHVEIDAHIASTSNPHAVTKSQVGLGNVPNLDTTQAIADSHVHANETVLDNTTASFTTADETKLDGIDTGATANDTDANLRSRATHTGTQSAATISDFSSAADARIAAAAGVSVASLSAGKIPTSQLPGLSLIDVNTVASEVAQLALTAQEGDVAIRTDLNKSYVHNGGTAGTMADWSELLTPTDQVTSVNGNTGAVTVAEVVHTHATTDLTATGGSSTSYLRKDNTWATPTNTTYSEIPTTEIDAGTASTSRTITGRRSKYIVDKAVAEAATATATAIAGTMGTVIHGATASTARPTGYGAITWIGSVAPLNMATNDLWLDNS